MKFYHLVAILAVFFSVGTIVGIGAHQIIQVSESSPTYQDKKKWVEDCAKNSFGVTKGYDQQFYEMAYPEKVKKCAEAWEEALD